jgi:hypothetical protein
MAARGWANSTMTAAGVAAGAGAAQFGLAYGLGIIVWQPVRDATGESLWLANLAWTLWIAASSTTLGAVYAGGLNTRATLATAAAKSAAATGAAAGSTAAAGNAPDRGGRRARVMDLASRTAITLAAVIGALITVPLVVLPARAAHRADTFQPEVTAGAYAVVGVIVGLVIAMAAVNVRVIAANVVASTGWVWLLAAVSVVDAVRANRTGGTAQLAAWQFTDRGWFRETLYLPGALLMLGGALLVGVFAALSADRRGDNRIGIATSGIFGPLLVAAAYFLAAPDLAVRAEQLSAYLFAPYAVVAGLAGSVLVAVLGPMRPRHARDRAAAAVPVSSPVRDTAPVAGAAATVPGEADLTEWTRTLAAGPPDPVYGLPEPAAEPTGADTAMAGADTAMAGADTATTAADAATTGLDPATPTATGRATVTQPVSPTVTQPAPPQVPKQRGRRGTGKPTAS